MGMFDFTVQTKGQLCLMAGKGAYIIQRKAANGEYVPMSVDGIKLRVSPSNTCVLIEFFGDYRIEWPEVDCCASDDMPQFEFFDIGNDIENTDSDSYIQSFCGKVAPDNGVYTPKIPKPVNIFGISKPECCELTVITSAGTIVIPANTTNYSAEFNQNVDLRPITLAGNCISQATLFVQHP